jgi:hypothetical protein
MGFFDRFRRRAPWTLDGIPRPWGKRKSIYGVLRDHTDPSSARLPDEKEASADELQFAPGAADGIFGHHVALSDQTVRANEIVFALEAACVDAKRINEVYEAVVKPNAVVLGVLDDLSDAIRKHGRLVPERVHAIARLLATEAADREAVKLGMALLGLFDSTDDRDVLITLGSHDELTLFAVVALINQEDDAELTIWELAKKVDGWGRIHAVERLADAKRPEVRAWMLREGFRNAVMNEYLAYTCAVAGRLHEALVDPDEALLRGATGILSALAAGPGPAKGLADWKDAPVAIERWLGHVEKLPLDLETLGALDMLRDHDDVAEPLRARITRLASSDAAAALVTEGLAAEDDVTFFRADTAARRRGVDTFDAHEVRLARGKGGSWFELMHQAKPDTIDRALKLAEAQIDLDKITTGAAKSLGIGREFAPHRDLDFVVQELARFPGKGEAFVRAALRSPVIRNRNMALRVLAAWKKGSWSPDLEDAAKHAADIEPDSSVGETFERVLAGKPYDPS